LQFLDEQNIKLEYNEKNCPPARLALATAEELPTPAGPVEGPRSSPTLVHECAHELLHKTERPHHDHRHRGAENRSRGRSFHRWTGHRLEMGNRQAAITSQMYAGNAPLLTESLEVIQRTSAVIWRLCLSKQPKKNQLTARRGGGLGRLYSSPVRRTALTGHCPRATFIVFQTASKGRRSNH